MSLGFSLISLALGRARGEREGREGDVDGRPGMSHRYSAGGECLNGYISAQANPVDTTRV